MGGRGEDMLFGGLCLVLALVNGWRLAAALRAGEVPAYRTRLRKDSMAPAKYAVLTAFHVALTGLLLVIAADLLFGLKLRGH